MRREAKHYFGGWSDYRIRVTAVLSGTLPTGERDVLYRPLSLDSVSHLREGRTYLLFLATREGRLREVNCKGNHLEVSPDATSRKPRESVARAVRRLVESHRVARRAELDGIEEDPELWGLDPARLPCLRAELESYEFQAGQFLGSDPWRDRCCSTPEAVQACGGGMVKCSEEDPRCPALEDLALGTEGSAPPQRHDALRD